jgi:hypothetical protein
LRKTDGSRTGVMDARVTPPKHVEDARERAYGGGPGMTAERVATVSKSCER